MSQLVYIDNEGDEQRVDVSDVRIGITFNGLELMRTDLVGFVLLLDYTLATGRRSLLCPDGSYPMLSTGEVLDVFVERGR